MALLVPSGVDLWQRAFDRLDGDLAKELSTITSGQHDILSEALQVVETKRQICYKRRWKVRFRPGGKEIVVRDVLEKIDWWIRKFRDVGDVAVQYDSSHASLPWAAIRFLLQASINEIELHAGVVEDLEMIVRTLARFKEFEKMYLQSTSSIRTRVEDALAALYATVLERLASALSYFEEPTVSRLLKAPFRSMDESARSSIRTREDEVLKLAGLGDTERSIHVEKTVVRLRDLALVSEKRVQDDEFFELLYWLSPTPYVRDHASIKASRIVGSGQWLLQHQTFVEWNTASSSDILLLHGIRGCGKSSVCSALIDFLLDAQAQQANTAPLAYFYCADSEADQERRKPVDILRSIVRQLTTSSEPPYKVQSSISSLYERIKAQAKLEGTPSDIARLGTAECKDLILESLDNNPATIIIDALDEVPVEKRHDLLSVLRDITQRSANVVKIFATSRDDHVLFETLSGARLLRVSSAETAKDVELYTKAVLDAVISEKRLLGGRVGVQLRDRLEADLVARAGEMFIWVKMQMARLCRLGHEQDVLAALSEASSNTLEDLYRSTFEGIRELGTTATGIVLRAFSWLLYMQEPMPAEELVRVVARTPAGVPSTPADLLRLSLGMIFLQQLDTHRRILQFSHHSVQEFLHAQPELGLHPGHRILASSSLSLLEAGPSAGITTTTGDLADDVAHCYAAVYWLHHLEQADLWSRDDDLYKQARNFIIDAKEPALTFLMWLDIVPEILKMLPETHFLKSRLRSVTSPSGSPIFALSIFRLGIFANYHQLPVSLDYNQANDLGETPLYLASHTGNEQMVCLLLKRKADVNVACGKHGNALHAACFHGHKTVVELLLRAGAHARSGKVYRTALDAAFRGAQEDVALVLLDWSHFGATAQHTADVIISNASKAGFLRVLELMQRRFAPGSLIDGSDQRPAVHAITSGKINSLQFIRKKASSASAAFPHNGVAIGAAYGQHEVIAYLLDAGLDIEANGPFGPPLRNACLTGHEPSVRMLLDRGAEVNANGDCGNALHAAAMKGHTHIVKLLIARGADVNQRGDYYGTALQAAAFRGHVDVVENLLDAQADVYAIGYAKDAFGAAAAGGHKKVEETFMRRGLTQRYEDSQGSSNNDDAFVGETSGRQQNKAPRLKLVIPPLPNQRPLGSVAVSAPAEDSTSSLTIPKLHLATPMESSQTPQQNGRTNSFGHSTQNGSVSATSSAYSALNFADMLKDPHSANSLSGSSAGVECEGFKSKKTEQDWRLTVHARAFQEEAERKRYRKPLSAAPEADQTGTEGEGIAENDAESEPAAELFAISLVRNKTKQNSIDVSDDSVPRLRLVDHKGLDRTQDALCSPTPNYEPEKQPELSDSSKPPIKFKDAEGRKFNFPWHLCRTWQGMEDLITQSSLQVGVASKQVYEGHYDLIGPDGEIISPQVWEKTVQPDWEITMHLRPLNELEFLSSVKLPDIESLSPSPGPQRLGLPSVDLSKMQVTPLPGSMDPRSEDTSPKTSPRSSAVHSPPLTPAAIYTRDGGAKPPTSAPAIRPPQDIMTPRRSASPQRPDAAGLVSTQPKQRPSYSHGPRRESQPSSREASPTGTSASTAAGLPRRTAGQKSNSIRKFEIHRRLYRIEELRYTCPVRDCGQTFRSKRKRLLHKRLEHDGDDRVSSPKRTPQRIETIAPSASGQDVVRRDSLIPEPYKNLKATDIENSFDLAAVMAIVVESATAEAK